MTREEFSKQLAELRVAVGMKKIDLYKKSLFKMPNVVIDDIENAKRNYGVEKAILILSCLGYKLRMKNDTSYVDVVSCEDVSDFFKSSMGDEVSQCGLARKINIVQQQIWATINGKYKVHIDLFLKMCDSLSISLSFVKTDD